MFDQLSREEREIIDGHVFACRILQAVKSIRQFASASLAEAMSLHADRYRILRAESPERFDCSHEAYWEGVYS
ncbi:MAG: hypothetical protein K2W96_06235 [Gemmataceae bacterium]|nr:hypothetical protein [Gemmataceae bacterium]